MAKTMRYLKWMMILHMFNAGYQSCISQLNGVIVLPNFCRLILTTSNRIQRDTYSTGIKDETDAKGVTPTNGVVSFC